VKETSLEESIVQGDRDRSVSAADLSPSRWPAAEYDAYMRAQAVVRAEAGACSGQNGVVTVSYNAFAARAGLEALKQGGSAIDAALTTALAQVALTCGAPISYFGILSLVTYDAASGRTQTMNAEWNTVAGETDPLSIPGGISFQGDDALRGTVPSGRTALVGGFMKGIEAAHRRFGKLPFARLFDPAIALAEDGFPVTPLLERQFAYRAADFARLAETRANFLKSDGTPYRAGETFRQPRLAATLRAVAEQGADYMYGGPWGEKLVAAVQADGGHMTLEDLRRYEVVWADPLVGEIGGGYAIHTNPWPNAGGVSLIEAQNLAGIAGLTSGPHWTKSPDALRKAHEITQQFTAAYLPDETLAAIYPGLDLSPEARVTRAHAEGLWARMEQGARLGNFKRVGPMHSDDVVAMDRDGSIAAITHSINCVYWGKTAITVDGISIGDPASFQQAQIARVVPGTRLPAPTETGIVFKDGKPVLGFASMGAGLHHRTFQCLLNHLRFGMSVVEAVDTPDFFMPHTDPATGDVSIAVPVGRFDPAVLDATGYAWREVPLAEARLGGAGDWVGISRDPETGLMTGASPNRNNGDAVAY